MLRTPKQNTIFHALVGKLQIDAETKAGLVSQFTKGRTESSAQMEYKEMQNLIASLQGNKQKPADKADRMRKKIIALAVHEMAWTMADINTFCRERGHVKHDSLNDYTVKELPALVLQFERVHATFIRNLSKK